MKRILTIIMTVMMAAAVISLTACGASEKSSEAKMAYAETAAYAEEAAYDEYAAGAYDLANVAAESTMGFDPNTGSNLVDNPNRKLIKDVNLEVETKEYDTLIASVKEKVTAFGGYIENSSASSPSVNDSYSNQSRYTNITARIPADNLDEFVEGVCAESNVTYKGESVTDITLQYTDTASRKKSLLEEQDRLNELMKKAETVEDLIAIEARLSEVRYQLESIESQLRTYDNQVDYSTVYLGIREVVEYTPQAEATLGEKISEGFSSCIHGLGSFFEGLFVFIIAYSPLLILLAGIVVLAVFLIKKGKKKRLAKKAAEAEKSGKELVQDPEQGSQKNE